MLSSSLRVVTAFFVSLLLGFLTIRLLYQTDWWFYLLVLLPLFFGGVGMLTVGPHNQRPSFTGRITAWLAWLGFWLSFLVWEAFHPDMVFITFSGCWAAGCDPGYANSPPSIDPLRFPVVFFIFFVFYGVGLLFVEVGVQLMIKYIYRGGNQSSASVLHEISAEDARRQLFLRRTQGSSSRSRPRAEVSAKPRHRQER